MEILCKNAFAFSKYLEKNLIPFQIEYRTSPGYSDFAERTWFVLDKNLTSDLLRKSFGSKRVYWKILPKDTKSFYFVLFED